VSTFVLEILAGSEPIEGVLRGPDGASRQFTGTLGLLAAIEALRDTAAAPTDSAPAKDFGTPT
jgi:hypothetical protein